MHGELYSNRFHTNSCPFKPIKNSQCVAMGLDCLPVGQAASNFDEARGAGIKCNN